MFSVHEGKPSQIIVVWTVGTRPPNAIQKLLLAAKVPGAEMLSTLERRLKHLGRAIRRGQEGGEGCSERDSGRYNLENGDQVTMAVARPQV